MKTILVTILIVFSSTIIFSQTKEVYLNDDLTQISKKEFEEKDSTKLFQKIKFDLDTLIVNVKFLRNKRGKISLKKLKTLKNQLAEASKKNIPSDHTLVINYYQGVDECISNSSKDFLEKKYLKYLKEIKEAEHISQFFVYSNSKGIENYGGNLEWIKDRHALLKETFFPINYPCTSFVLIDKSGNFYLRRAEYHIEMIPKLLKNKQKTLSNN